MYGSSVKDGSFARSRGISVERSPAKRDLQKPGMGGAVTRVATAHEDSPSRSVTCKSAHRHAGNGIVGDQRPLPKRVLRVISRIVFFPFYSKRKARATLARPLPTGRPQQYVPGETHCSHSLDVKRARNIDFMVPQDKSISSRAEPGLGIRHDILTHTGTRHYIQDQWQHVESNGTFERADIDRLVATLTHRLLSNPSAACGWQGGRRAEDACTRAIMVSDALAQATHGDPVRARAALEALLENVGDAPERVKADVFALQVALGTTGVGIETLLDIAPHVLPPKGGDGGSTGREIQQEAFRQALRAARYLLHNKPANEDGPTSLEALANSADRVLPSAERLFDAGHRVISAPIAPEAVPAWLGEARNTLAIKALHAANALRADPSAQCPPHLAQAYMAWRNGFDCEGVGSDLSKAQSRLFKLFTYIDRAAESGKMVRAVSGLLGKNKSPLSALQNLGTIGALLGRPDEEFDHFTAAVGAVRDRLKRQLSGDEQVSPALKAQRAVRLAALDQWQQRMASKGLRSQFRFSASDLKSIAIRARALYSTVLHEANVVDVHGDRNRNMEAVRTELNKLAKMTPHELHCWARDAWSEGVPSAVQSKLDIFQARVSADIRPKPGDEQQQFDALEELVRQLPDASDVRVSGGGTYGLAGLPSESLAAFSSGIAVPHVSILPDAGYIKGRHAVIDIGSNAQFGHLFIGSDSRSSWYGGIGGFAGWALGNKGLATLGASIGIRGSRDSGALRGISIRTRRSDDEKPGKPDAWRTTMLEVLRTARCAGPNEGRPRTADEMWAGLAHRFWKAPEFSINWTDSYSRTISVSGSAGITARVGTPYTKWGPSLSADFKKTTSTVTRIKDKTGTHAIDVATNNSGKAVTVSASIVQGMPSVSVAHGGHLESISFPSLPVVGVAKMLSATNTNASLRIARDGDRIVPGHSFKDTEFGTFKDFKRYVDRYRAQWLAALGGTDDARRRLDQMVATVKECANAGDLVMGERQHLTDEAANYLDVLFHLKRRLECLRTPAAAQADQLACINSEIRRTLASASSWRTQSLYALEQLGAQRTLGLSFLLSTKSIQSVSGAREMAGLSLPRVAGAHRRESLSDPISIRL